MNARLLALEALKYHQEQTRPIQRTIDAIAALEADIAKVVEPVAWSVYVAEVANGYLVDDLDDAQLVDDCTNHNAVVTPLFAAPQQVAINAELLAALKTVIDMVASGVPDLEAVIEARAAIAKAEATKGDQS